MGRRYETDRTFKALEKFLNPNLTEGERDEAYDILDDAFEDEYNDGFDDGANEPCDCPDPEDQYNEGYEKAQEDFESPDTFELIDALKKNDYDHAQVLLGRCGIHVLKAQLKP